MRFTFARNMLAPVLLLSVLLSSPPAISDMARIGQPAPRLTLRDLDGRIFSLSNVAYPGPARQIHPRHPVLLDFFGTHCPPCKAKLPKIVALHKERASQGLVIVLVALLDSNDPDAEQKLKDYLARNPVPFTVVLDRFEDAGKRFIHDGQSMALGSMVLVDEEGIVRGVDASLEGGLLDTIEAVLSKPRATAAIGR